MASPLSRLFTICVAASLVLLPCLGQPFCSIQAIYQLGDSISDTGNLIRIDPITAANVAKLPYGESFSDGPTGRCSNGMLMIDYLANSLQLPFLSPYLERNASFDSGVNFAVAGSTALDSSFFAARGVFVPPANSPLNRQLEWFRQHLHSTCGTPLACASRLRKSLVMVGEIGGNDYNYFFLGGRPIGEIRTVIPHVVGAITNAVREVVRLGANRIVVPGNFPIGCLPSYLTQFGRPGSYDEMGCIRYLNGLAIQHNNYLQRALALLRREFPHTSIVYSDYYSAFEFIILQAHKLGFNSSNTLKACCGGGGSYNFNGSSICGSPGVPVCSNPDEYISWDGVHLTQNAYNYMSQILIPNILARIRCRF